MARATTDFPVPVSPRMSTVVFESATAFDQVQHFPHLMGAADDHVERRAGVELTVVAGGPLRVALTQRPADDITELAVLERLGQEIESAGFQGLDRRVEGVVAAGADHPARRASVRAPGGEPPARRHPRRGI